MGLQNREHCQSDVLPRAANRGHPPTHWHSGARLRVSTAGARTWTTARWQGTELLPGNLHGTGSKNKGCAAVPLCLAATVLGRHCARPPLCSAATVLGRHCAWLSATHFPPLHKHTRAHSRAARVPRAGLRACASAVVRRLPVVGRSTRCSAGPPPGPSARPTPSLSRAPVRKTWAALSFDGPNHLGFWFTARIAPLPRSLRRACQGLPLKAGSSVGCTPARPHVRVSTDVYTNPVDREERWMQRGSQTSGAWRGSNQGDARIVGGLDRVDHLFELSDSLTSRCGPRCSATDWLQLVTLPALKR